MERVLYVSAGDGEACGSLGLALADDADAALDDVFQDIARAIILKRARLEGVISTGSGCI